MEQFLTFAMVAPIASFGDLSIGERREGRDRPALSAVLGLVAASLGIIREDEEAHTHLAREYGVGVLCYASGSMIIDYHTAQAVPTSKKQKFATRREELLSSAKEPVTVLSERDYRMGVWHIGALWLRNPSARWSLDRLKQAMLQPVFMLSLGRRSCPLALPLAPQIQEASTVTEALIKRHEEGPEAYLGTKKSSVSLPVEESKANQREKHLTDENKPQAGSQQKRKSFRDLFSKVAHNKELLITMDAADVATQGGEGYLLRREKRRDFPLSRSRWQFGVREEALLAVRTKGHSQ
ncbi:type I-E CRISPR-associated protein Cas5/CasD [Entomobacter blattae]|uniref:CRISPR-associated protein Cas5 n=1 Tax=Entomobacter blattae TaxID=2762277 RepID=A0A7H1NU61_9PROT|nr:type I-E CRISPR-associated protein Cas5/CasD [Entomobacter blattae]QNT79321.1 CRISPR-associated protein Cas5 [Entomobacter blattae]